MSLPAEVQSLMMTKAEARSIVDQIKSHAESMRKLIYDLHQREGWKALGYESWRECVVTEFEQAQRTLYQQLNAAQVEEVLRHGAIGEIPERQLRPLSPLRDRPDQLREAWSTANERTGGNPTGRDVQQAVDEVIGMQSPDLFVLNQSSFLDDDEPEAEAPAEASWTESERERRDEAERGFTVVANLRCDHRLIAWAQAEGRYVRIDRMSPYGNPMKLEWMNNDRDAVLQWYREHWLPFIYKDQHIFDLDGGKVLGCWCYPEKCHGDVICEQLPNEERGCDDEA